MRKQVFKLAVGLGYDNAGHQAPTIDVKGANLRADDIVKIAQRYGVPVVDDPKLAQALNAVPLDGEIPEELFQTVAVLLNSLEKKL